MSQQLSASPRRQARSFGALQLGLRGGGRGASLRGGVIRLGLRRPTPGSWAGFAAGAAATIRACQVAPPPALPASPALFGGEEGPGAWSRSLPSHAGAPPRAAGPSQLLPPSSSGFRASRSIRRAAAIGPVPRPLLAWGRRRRRRRSGPVVPARLHALRCGAGPRGGRARGQRGRRRPAARGARCAGPRGAGRMHRAAGSTDGRLSPGGAGWTGVGFLSGAPGAPLAALGKFKGAARYSCQLAGGWGECREAKSPTEAPHPALAADVRARDLAVLAGPRCRLRGLGSRLLEGHLRWPGAQRPLRRASTQARLRSHRPSGHVSGRFRTRAGRGGRPRGGPGPGPGPPRAACGAGPTADTNGRGPRCTRPRERVEPAGWPRPPGELPGSAESSGFSPEGGRAKRPGAGRAGTAASEIEAEERGAQGDRMESWPRRGPTPLGVGGPRMEAGEERGCAAVVSGSSPSQAWGWQTRPWTLWPARGGKER